MVLTTEKLFLHRKTVRSPDGGRHVWGASGTLADPRIHVAHSEDVAMRTNLNFSPLFRSTIGFDRVFDLLENASRTQTFESWPPYDIVRASEDSYRITMAVAGFSDSEINITHQPNLLIVSGDRPEDAGEYLHRGLPGNSFERRFELADHVKIANATLQNGLLSISLVREIPEEMKPRKISIKTSASAGESKQIESGKQAA